MHVLSAQLACANSLMPKRYFVQTNALHYLAIRWFVSRIGLARTVYTVGVRILKIN